MERTKLLTFAIIGLLLLNLLTIGFVVLQSSHSTQRGQMQGPPPNGQEPARIIIARLHFDEQQQRQYLDMVRQHQQQTMRLNTESVRLFQAYYKLLRSTQSDSTKSTLVQQITDVQRQIAELNFSHFQQIKALCRPGQQADFAKLVDDLAHLFGQPQRPPHPHGDRPPEGFPGGRPEGSPEPFRPNP